MRSIGKRPATLYALKEESRSPAAIGRNAHYDWNLLFKVLLRSYQHWFMRKFLQSNFNFMSDRQESAASRMKSLMHLAQVCVGDVRVDLGSIDARMPEELLD